MNKQKQREIKGFLGWLEGYLGVKGGEPRAQDRIAELLRSRLRGANGGAQKEQQEAGHRSCQRRDRADLRAEFEGSMGKLAPLRERIRKTDELIDATVYRLYGLTEEEIGIEEGSNRK